MCQKIYFFILVIHLSVILSCLSTKANQLNETTIEILSNNSIKNNYLKTKARQFSIIPSLLKGLDVFNLKIPINIPYSTYITDLISNVSDNGIATSSLLNLNVMSISLLGGLFLLAYLLYPKYFASIAISSFRSLGDLNFLAMEDLSEKFNKAMNKFEIDSTTCMKVALCTLAKANYNNKLAKTKSFTTIDLLDGVLSLSLVNDLFVAKKGLSQARDFGKSGGDCNSLNREKKCPLDDQTWNLLLSSVNSSIF